VAGAGCPPCCAGEQQPIAFFANVFRQMRFECGGIATSRMPAADHFVGQDEVHPLQLGQLAEPQRAPGREQHHGLILLGHLLGDDPNFVE
jgi:hypothetical protein